MIIIKAVFLKNPLNHKEHITNYIIQSLQKKYDSLDTFFPNGKDELRTLILSKRYDVIIFDGGDGTFNTIINIIMKLDYKPILGYIPAGTVCDISKNLNIPKSVKKAVEVITEGNITYHDVGKVNEMYFFYAIASGKFSSVSIQAKEHHKKSYGRIVYFLLCIKEVFKNMNFKIKYFNLETTTPLVIIMNSKSIAGLNLNKNGHRNDGTMDMFIVKPGILFGTLNICKLFFLHKCDKEIINKIKIQSDNTWCIDGELGPTGSINIEVIKKGVRIFTPIR